MEETTGRETRSFQRQIKQLWYGLHNVHLGKKQIMDYKTGLLEARSLGLPSCFGV